MEHLNAFFNRLRCFTNAYNELNSGCKSGDFIEIEKVINYQFPEDLKEMYLLHNGQVGDTKGIFKTLSGYDKYSRPKFLTLNSICELYKILNSRGYPDSIYDSKLIPIAVDNFDNPDDVICYDIINGNIYLLWVLCYDLFTPIDWQLAKIKIADSLDKFLERQTEFYGI